MFFRRKKKLIQKLRESYGKTKTEALNFELIKRYFVNKTHDNAYQVLSDQTAHDLDLDLLFWRIDHTESRIGQQYLYDKLRTIQYDPQKNEQQERIIRFFNENPEERLKIQLQLNKLNNQQSYYIADLFQKKIEKRPKWLFIIRLLSFTVFASIILLFFSSSYILLLLALIPINAIIHYGLKRRTSVFVNAIPSLLTLNAVAKNLNKIDALKNEDKSLQDSFRTMATIKRKMSFIKLEQKLDSDMEAAFWFVLELVKITFLLEPLLLFSSSELIRTKSKEIEEIYRFVGSIDSNLSIAAMRLNTEYCLPKINSSNTIEFEDITHHLIEDCVKNSIKSERPMLLTGSNMSGKTTFIRAIGLNYITGMTLNTCFAASASIPIAQLFSIIRIDDDVSSNSSYFFSEVDQMKTVIENTRAGEPTILLFDELFKGTNTKERVSLAKAILSYLANGNNKIFVATHDVELTTLLKGEFDLYHFTESVSDANIQFDYKLKPGILKAGNAIKILDVNGFPSSIIEEALAIANKT